MSVLKIKASFLCSLLILGTAVFTTSRLSPTPAIPESAPLEEFSSARALVHLRIIADKPHPVASEEHEKVKNYILGELRRMGLQPEVQERIFFNQCFGTSGATVQNILARIPGNAPTKAVALSSHYDSVPNSRGASDDGAGVVTLLETARALLHAPKLQNDVILLFTDAEESGLLGAKAFIEHHPWQKDVGVFLNFESRGNSGPSVMFRATPENGFMISALAHAAPRPIANSLISTLVLLIENDPDLTYLSKTGIPGMEFAYAGGLTRYHSYNDSVENLDERSLQHHGTYALSLARYFGNLDLRQTKQSSLVYFDLWGFYVIHYSKLWAAIFGIISAILFLIAVNARRCNRIEILRSSGFCALILILSVIGGFLAFYVLSLLKNMWNLVAYQGQWIWGFLLLSAGISIWIYQLFERRYKARDGIEWVAGFLLVLVTSGVLTGFFLPGPSYLFQWSAIPLSLGLFFYKKRPWVFYLSCLPAVFFLSNLSYTLFLLEGGLAPSVTSACYIFLLSLFFGRMTFLPQNLGKLVPAITVSGAIIFFLVQAMRLKFNGDFPWYSYLVYGVDTDQKKSFWIVDEESFFHPWVRKTFEKAQKHELVSELFSEEFPVRVLQDTYHAEVPPEGTIISNLQGNISLLLETSQPGSCLYLWERNKKRLNSLAINGERAEPIIRMISDLDQALFKPKPVFNTCFWPLRFCSVPKAGIEVQLSFSELGPYDFQVMQAANWFINRSLFWSIFSVHGSFQAQQFTSLLQKMQSFK